MEENTSVPGQNVYDNMKFNLPNATAVLILGIVSIVTCFCYGIVGFICGIIAIVLAGKDARLYNTDPSRYTPSSYGNLKAGRICAIIGIVLSALYLLIIIVLISTIGLEALRHPDQLMQHYQP